MTALILASCIALYAGYRWGRYSRLQQFVQICGGDELAQRELVTMAEMTRHRNILGVGDKENAAVLAGIHDLWERSGLCEDAEEWDDYGRPRPGERVENQRVREALLTISEALGMPLGARW